MKIGIQQRVVIAIVLTGIFPLIIGISLTYFYEMKEFEKSIGTNFKELAKETAKQIKILINKEVDGITILFSSGEVMDMLTDANNSKSLPKKKKITQDYLNNTISKHLKSHINIFSGEYHSILLSDIKGRVISSSKRLNNLNMRNEEWWRAAYDNGRGKIYIGDFYEGDNKDEYLMDIAIPLIDKNGKIIGIGKSTIIIENLFNAILDVKIGNTGHANLINSDGTILACPYFPPRSHSITSSLLKKIIKPAGGWTIAEDDAHGKSGSIIGFSSIGEILKLGSTSFGGKKWYIFTRQDPEETFAPIYGLLSRIFYTGLILIVALSVIGMWAARRLVKPIFLLQEGVKLIGEGNLEHRLEIKTKDELEDLANGFNGMVASLKHKNEEIMRHIKELSALNSVASAVNQSLNLKIIMHEALKEVMEVADMKAGWIYIPIDDNSEFKIEAYEGVDEGFIDRIDLLKRGEGFAGRVALSGKPIILEDISDDPRISRGAVLDAGFKALASIPLCYKEKILGVMNIASYETHLFTHDEAEMLISIGNLIGTALENSMLYERVKKDVEEMEKTRDLLIRTTTLASLGELSANVAHEINNPLTGILTHISLLVSETPDTNPAKKRLGIIHDETLRIRYIVRNLLDFARQSEPRMETVNITDVIKGTVALVSHAAKISNIDIIEKHPQNIIPKVSVDVGQMKQVFLNLFNNAFYAMGKGGTLTIEVSADKSYVNIHIKDTGAGIPHEVLPKIFDPFFTTKPGTKGTGLGLSVSYGIVEQHGGVIEVESEINKGSTFIVKLPAKN